MASDVKTETRLRFRINMLLAERDMTIKQLYKRVTEMGFTISSSHFYRQMKPYHSPMRMDLLAYVVRALKADPAELFELVEMEVVGDTDDVAPAKKAAVDPKPIDEDVESERAKKARKTAKQKRELAMLGTKIAVIPNSGKK